MKILVVYTGGTIGSTLGADYVSPDEGKAYVLIEQFRKCREGNEDFEYATPYTILSENLTGEHIRCLGNCILEALNKDYDGIIVLHGTDTLQYSAAAVSYALIDVRIPVVFVSSNYVLEDERANGLENFSCGVDFIENHRGKGVFVVYRNMDGKVYVHRGTRVLPHLPYSDEVFSVLGQYYGVYEEGKYRENEAYQGSGRQNAPLCLPGSRSAGVVRIIPYPGMGYPALHGRVKAVLLDSYHSGTICGTSNELKEFLKTAGELSIPVFLTGADAGADYESIREWEDSGVMVLPPASNVAMYVKLWMLTDERKWSVTELCEKMRQPMAEDIVEAGR